MPQDKLAEPEPVLSVVAPTIIGNPWPASGLVVSLGYAKPIVPILYSVFNGPRVFPSLSSYPLPAELTTWTPTWVAVLRASSIISPDAVPAVSTLIYLATVVGIPCPILILIIEGFLFTVGWVVLTVTAPVPPYPE